MNQVTESNQMNILLLADDFYPKTSGGAFIDWNVAKHLVETGDSVTVVTPRNTDTASQETVEGVEIRRPFRGHDLAVHPNSTRGITRRMLFVVLIVPYLIKLCWQKDFDLVYSTNHLLHPPAAIISAVFRLSHISFVGYSPSIQKDALLRNPFVFLERLNFWFFIGDRVLSRTPSIREIVSEIYDREAVQLDGIVDKEAIESIAGSAGIDGQTNSEEDIRLIFVGRLVEIKNPAELIYLIPQLPQEYSLRIVGDGPHRQIVEAAVEDAGVDDRVRLEGRLSHEETLQLIADSDLLLLPSEMEAYPSVVFEGLVLNTPVLATPVGVLPTIEHPRLTIAELEQFPDLIPKISLKSEEGIDKETLERFSVDRFSEGVRDQMSSEIYSFR